MPARTSENSRQFDFLTEQGAYLDGFDKPAEHEKGTRDLLDNLEKELRGVSAS